jgi:chemotaxis protein MotA
MMVVLGAVAGGYIMVHGNFSVLFQPAELVIIFGAATGSLMIASPGKIFHAVVKDIKHVFTDTKVGKEQYLELLLLFNALFYKIKKEGLISVEADIDNYKKSALFLKFPNVMMKDEEAADFICDTIRVMITANYPPHEVEALMEIDLEINSHERLVPSHMITKVADALPGLGIVAAVLGVVLTMGIIDSPVEVLGHHIGAALVGTFLGILASYGFVGPMATNLEHKAKERETYMNVLKTTLLAAYSTQFMVQFAIEAGRRSIPNENRPSFAETDIAMKKAKSKG